MKKRTAVVTTASESFQSYIPLWAFCLGESYPDYQAIVFLTDPITNTLSWARRGLDNLMIVHGEFEDYPHRPPRFAAWARYLLFTSDRAHYWKDFDHVYITDVDLLIVREDPPLHLQHLAHAKELGLTYSNLLRDPTRFEDKHMTALHFCTRQFIDQVRETSDRYDQKIRECGTCVLDGKSIIHDERLLYQIVRDSGLTLPPYLEDQDIRAEDYHNYRQAQFRPWHGINIGRGMVSSIDKQTFVRARLLWWFDTLRSVADLAWQNPQFWDYWEYLTPQAKSALRSIMKLSGFELRRKSDGWDLPNTQSA